MSSTAFLDVEDSLTGQFWAGPDAALIRQAEALQQQTDLPEALCRILAARDVTAEQAPAFLDPKLRDLLPDPRQMKDVEIAASRIVDAALKGQKLAIFADYDVDGGSSAALLLDWLHQLGRDATLYVPDRIDEGYGPNESAMTELAAHHDLIICVDCGTLSFDAIAAADTADVIILDHHLGGEALPKALAVVNPNRQDEGGELGHLCAAAVVFLTLVEANRVLKSNGKSPPNLMAMLDLVALATVADVAPLIGVNRALVRQGLKIMAGRQRPGLVALADAASLNAPPSSYHLGYVFGPRVNAGGRVGKADLGARLLSSRDTDEARAMADRLDQFNTERREIEARVRELAMEQAEERGLDGPLVWAAGEGWHPGVVGIVAARLKEATGRPAVIIGLDGDEGKGSGRSVKGIDLGQAVHRLQGEGLLIKGGGHKMAAGLTVDRAQLPAAMERLGDLLARQGSGLDGPKSLRVDAALMPGAATPEFMEQIEMAGPFGQSAPAPRFVYPDVVVHHAKEVGSGHLKFAFGDGLSARMNGIAFGAFDTALGQALSRHGGKRFHLAGRLDINHWGGRQNVELRLEDAAPAQD